MSTRSSLDERLVREAAQWLALMYSGRFTQEDAQRCEQWRTQSPDHQRVWQGVEQLKNKFNSVPPELGMPVLGRRRAIPNRRAILKSLALIGSASSTLWLALRSSHWQTLTAQYTTSTGERRNIRLADNSQLSLNTSSAIDVQFDDTQRMIWHRAGEILIQTAPDPNPAHNRPFIVQTSQGSLHALGTRFIVRHGDASVRLTVLEGAVQVRPDRAPELTRVEHAGRQLIFTADSIKPGAPAPAGADGWVSGVLYAEEMRLADFAAELARYRTGIIRCDSTASNVRVSGSFQLDDTDRILQVLATTLPIRIDFRSRYWVTLTAL